MLHDFFKFIYFDAHVDKTLDNALSGIFYAEPPRRSNAFGRKAMEFDKSEMI